MSQSLLKISDAYARVLERAANINYKRQNDEDDQDQFDNRYDNDDYLDVDEDIYLDFDEDAYLDTNDNRKNDNRKNDNDRYPKIFLKNVHPNGFRMNIQSPIFDHNLIPRSTTAVKLIKKNDNSIDIIVDFPRQNKYPRNPIYRKTSSSNKKNL